MKELNINGYKEQIIERSDYPIERCKEILSKKVKSWTKKEKNSSKKKKKHK